MNFNSPIIPRRGEEKEEKRKKERKVYQLSLTSQIIESIFKESSSKRFKLKEHVLCVALSIEIIKIEMHELCSLTMLTSEKGFRKA